MPYFPPADRHDAIVLVHGAWVGEWSWLPVIGLLRASGRRVEAVSLTGHGTRAHQSGPQVDLGTHVTDVVGVIETFDLDSVTLVGHSYGGRVITGVAARIGHRLRALVFVDAHAPVAPEPPEPAGRADLAAANGGMLPFFEAYRPTEALVGDVGWFMDRVRPQSYACFTDPWQLDLPDHPTRTYVYATENPDSRFAHYAEACRRLDDWTVVDLPGPHWLMLSHPAEIARIVLDA